jgi:hypothetical protein
MYNLDKIIKDGYNLDEIIENSFKDTIEYLNNNGIKTGKLKLIIAKPPYLFFSKISSFLNSSALIYGLSFYETLSNMTHHNIPFLIKFFLSFSISTLPIAIYYKKLIDQTSIGFYSPTGEVYIKEKVLRKTIDEILNNLSFMKIIGPSIIGLQSDLSILTYPVYINGNNIEKDIVKALTDIIVDHEIAHVVLRSIGSNNEWKASAFELLVYIYENELDKYSEVYEIIKENIRTCKDYVENEYLLNIEDKDPWISDLGRCYANIIIDKNKWSSKVNIKDLIEEIKYLSRKDVINIIKSYNID